MRDRVDPESAFLAIRFLRHIERLGPRLADPAFWLELNPDLTISDRPLSQGVAEYAPPDGRMPARMHQLKTEGYCVIPPVVPPAEVQQLRATIRRTLDAGFPAYFLRLYDEFYRVNAALRGVLSPVLGPDPIVVPDSCNVFHVPAGTGQFGRLGAFAAHRDGNVVDPGILAGELPTAVVAWTALTDVTPLDSCLYVVPADADRDYRSHMRNVRVDHFGLQDVRAVPAPAGAVVVMSTHLIHWGSRGSVTAPEPRQSMAAMMQRPDVPARHDTVVSLDAPMPFATRWRAVCDNARATLAEGHAAAVDRMSGP
jgi:hypothetical protein